MLTVTTAVRQLKQERARAQKEVEKLDAAIRVLSGLTGTKPGLGRRASVGKRRTMSAAARKRIAAAQRARWAKWKAAHPKK